MKHEVPSIWTNLILSSEAEIKYWMVYFGEMGSLMKMKGGGNSSTRETTSLSEFIKDGKSRRDHAIYNSLLRVDANFKKEHGTFNRNHY